MTYSVSEGLFVIFITLVGMGFLLGLTWKVPFQKIDYFLLAVTIICYVFDTIWWWFDLHFKWSDWYFTFHGHREQVTIFFIVAAISFCSLIVLRFKKMKKI
ncbi:hypothetical protein JZO76_04835 [Enterococcus sp. MJM12]|uniref:Lycopene cyclase domain-containing protein n=1 Tax=Candidatus Enterococcus myersii TaxID=2815322 RepID=A0ABS3H5X0_9ENTE|nr:hypothetical protein [Enterococcus sp. MJM12]MBO0448857.1 hypothetical protein [Enterococcus sp. MJM12]